jgi:hypothetical protein
VAWHMSGVVYLGQSTVYSRGSRQSQEIRTVLLAGNDLHTKRIVFSSSRAEPTGTKESEV